MKIDPERIAFKSNDATLYGYMWQSEADGAPYVVMSHGLTNHHEDAPMFERLRSHFVSAGLGVFMFDYFGSGESDGDFREKTWTGMRQNLADALDLVEERTSRPIALVARSVGASIAGFFAKDARLCCSVLASPVLYLIDRFGSIPGPDSGEIVQMPENLERSGQIKGAWELNRRFFDELRDTEQALAEAVDGARNVLVIHGNDDPKVSSTNSERLYELLAEPKRFVAVEGADHYYTGVEAQVVEASTAWVLGFAEVERVTA